MVAEKSLFRKSLEEDSEPVALGSLDLEEAGARWDTRVQPQKMVDPLLPKASLDLVILDD
jgi:hypothetical protein